MPTPLQTYPHRHLPSFPSPSGTSGLTHPPTPLPALQTSMYMHGARRIAVDEVDMRAEQPDRFAFRLGHRNGNEGGRDRDRSLGSPYAFGISTPNSKNHNVTFSRLPPEYIPASPDPGGVEGELEVEVARGRPTFSPHWHHHRNYDYDGDHDSIVLSPTSTASSSEHHHVYHRGAMLDMGNGEAISIRSGDHSLERTSGSESRHRSLSPSHPRHGQPRTSASPSPPFPSPYPFPSPSAFSFRSASLPLHTVHRDMTGQKQHGQPRVSASPSPPFPSPYPFPSPSASSFRSASLSPHTVHRDMTGTHRAQPGRGSAMSTPSGPVHTVQLPTVQAPGPATRPIPIRLPTHSGRQHNHGLEYSATYPWHTTMRGHGYGYGGGVATSSQSAPVPGHDFGSRSPNTRPHAHRNEHEHEHEHGFLSRLLGYHKSRSLPHPHHAPGGGPALAAGVGSGKSARVAPQVPWYPQTQSYYYPMQTNYPPMPMRCYGGIGAGGHRYGFGGSLGL